MSWPKCAVLVSLALASCTNPVETQPFSEAWNDSQQPVTEDERPVVYALDVSHWSRTVADAELRCMWDAGVRHFIAGTQNSQITRQQLAQAVKGGMTIDAYVYLYWREDIATQVERALTTIEGLPVGILWLDVEEDPAGHEPEEIESMVVDAAAACGDMPCGIYTGRSYWVWNVGNSEAFSHLPLWYALYDGKWDIDGYFDAYPFGGWPSADAKQVTGNTRVCGVTVDENLMRVEATPSVVLDRTPVQLDGPPAKPTGLYPDGGLAIETSWVRVMSDEVAGATSYEFQVEFASGDEWRTYATWTPTNAIVSLTPTMSDRAYRFRVRADNAHGPGPWSAWAVFAMGEAQLPQDASDTEVEPPVDTGPPQSLLAPSGLLPANGDVVTTPEVRLNVDEVPSATRYRFIVELNWSGSDFIPFQTSEVSSAQLTFWPPVRYRDFRFRAQVEIDGAWGPLSEASTFRVGS